MKKIFTAVLVLCLLAGCRGNVPEAGESVSETVNTAAEVSENTSTTITAVSTVVSEEAETTSASADTETKISEREHAEFVKLAEENSAVKVDILTDKKDIYNSAEMLVGYFYAEYPEVSGADEAVCEKINGAVKEHIDGILKEQQDYMYDLCVGEGGRVDDMFLFWLNDLERKELRTIRCEINCNYGNLFSVYFNEYSYNMVLPEKHYVPYTIVFDLRTGEQVDFDEIISNKESFDGVFEKAFADYGSYSKYESGSMYYPVYMGECDYMLFDYVTVKNDCLGMYLAKPTARDSMPTEINEVCVPISDVAPYLTEEGRKLFRGFYKADFSGGVSADEVYDVYPKRIIYPEKTETNITAEKAEINEELKKDGCTVFEFTAVYPVFGGWDETVTRKINDGVKAYIDSVYEEISRCVEEFDLDKDGDMIIPPWHFSMTIRALGSGGWENGIDLDYDINGNILSVNFYTSDYAPPAAHGAVSPVSLVFDLRTGERVIFNDIFEDKEAVANEINMAAYQYFENRWRSGGVEGYESGFEKFAESPDYYDLDGGCVTVKSGCLSYCTVPYEFGGSFADGMELMDVAVEDIYPYLNEAGRSLFEGFASAKSEPVNIIEKNGEKYFDFEKADD